jgi:hypothetical protein
MANEPHDLIGYDALQQEALRGVVRAALKKASAKGLPGEHHFYLSFRTRAPGVSMPPELLEQYPSEMTIALQHQYWDLAPGETFFSVVLRFGGQPKSLSVPYAAITDFWDPSVDYRLRFSVAESAPAVLASAPAGSEPPLADKDGQPAKIVSLDQFRKK